VPRRSTAAWRSGRDPDPDPAIRLRKATGTLVSYGVPLEVSVRSTHARLCALVALSIVVSAPATAQTTRPTIAVLNFEFGSIQHWWSGNQDIGAGISDMLVDELVNDGSFRLIERKQLEAIMAEQNLAQSERADPSAKTLVQIGKLLGARYIVTGSVTKFGTENSNKSVSGGGWGSKFGVGSVGTAKGKANVAIATRIIDTTTGEIMASAKGEGTSKRSGLLLAGAGGGGVGAAGRIEFGSSNFRETILGEATEMAVKSTAEKLVAARSRLQ
jgi:curli biogenesis system outer membrane secretion channel CsgG